MAGSPQRRGVDMVQDPVQQLRRRPRRHRQAVGIRRGEYGGDRSQLGDLGRAAGAAGEVGPDREVLLRVEMTEDKGAEVVPPLTTLRAIANNHVRSEPSPGSYLGALRQARRKVSWTASSASPGSSSQRRAKR